MPAPQGYVTGISPSSFTPKITGTIVIRFNNFPVFTERTWAKTVDLIVRVAGAWVPFNNHSKASPLQYLDQVVNSTGLKALNLAGSGIELKQLIIRLPPAMEMAGFAGSSTGIQSHGLQTAG